MYAGVSECSLPLCRKNSCGIGQASIPTHHPHSLKPSSQPKRGASENLLELHFTRHPWLLARVLVEIELSVLVNQCLKQRIPDRYTLQRESTAWETIRNAQKATVNWRFGVTDARVKLERLYLKIQS